MFSGKAIIKSWTLFCNLNLKYEESFPDFVLGEKRKGGNLNEVLGKTTKIKWLLPLFPFSSPYSLVLLPLVRFALKIYTRYTYNKANPFWKSRSSNSHNCYCHKPIFSPFGLISYRQEVCGFWNVVGSLQCTIFYWWPHAVWYLISFVLLRRWNTIQARCQDDP